MFDFAKAEVNGLKNVLKAYFFIKNQRGISGDLPYDLMNDFALWYYEFRLGPPYIMPAGKSVIIQDLAVRRMNSYASSNFGGRINLICILYGLMAAEGVLGDNMDLQALQRVFEKYNRIAPEISGMTNDRLYRIPAPATGPVTPEPKYHILHCPYCNVKLRIKQVFQKTEVRCATCCREFNVNP